jgi:amino acid adenylation domain-containing protein
MHMSVEDDVSLVRRWNDTRSPYPRDETIVGRFAAQVTAAPAAIAVTFGSQSLTYAQLDVRANQLAHLLQAHGVGLESPVGIALPRSIELIVALLAVVKSGGAYVPLDLANPPARSAYILSDSSADLVITNAALIDDYAPARTLAIDRLADELVTRPTSPPPCPTTADHLAYLCYTSGSTGQPKGTAVPQRGVIRLVHNPDYVTLGPGETILQLCAIAFDVSVFEVWGALLTGARLAVAPPGRLSLPELATVLREQQVTTAWLTAGLFHQVVELDVSILSGVRQLLAGGDVLAPGAVRAALAARGNMPMINGYGPTENSTFATCYRMTDPEQVGDRTPIGTPIPQSTAYVLDDELRPVGIGVAGELCLGGDGVARGYINRAALTASKFVPDPFTGEPGARMYRTGDLARWRADGVLEFLGRLDGQVKIRGFRIEPGEVEALLRGRDEVREAVVVVRGDGEAKHLVAYVTVSGHHDPATVSRDLLAHAAVHLPEYLIPSAVVLLDELPLNISGKVDRQALPEPAPIGTLTAVPTIAAPAAPVSAVHERLTGMWRDILRVPKVDDDDDFFALGGNSLAATRLIFRIRDAFAVDLPLTSLYDDPTLVATVRVIEAMRPPGAPADERSGNPAGPGRPPTGGIMRRDRSTYRTGGATTLAPPAAPARAVAAPIAPAPAMPSHPVPSHLVPLSRDWALWRWVCLRAPGFSFDLHDAVGCPDLAEVADQIAIADSDELRADYEIAYAKAERTLSAALHAAAADPRFRRAISWQNRTALGTGIDSLLRRDPQTVVRTGRYRKYETLVASYLQRYTAKNDTIGFFGPVGWVHIRPDGPSIEHRPKPAGALASRTLYLEDWATRRLADTLSPGLEPWLVPRRLPLTYARTSETGTSLELPFAPPVPLSPLAAAVLREIDGARTATDVVARLRGTQHAGGDDTVWQTLADLRDQHVIAWQLDVAADDIHSRRSLRSRLSTVTDPALREPALAALAELDAAVENLDAAAVRNAPDELVDGLDALDATFTRLTGTAPTRRPGKLYAGRTLAFEESLRADDLTFGASLFETLADPLDLILTAARWFTAAGAALFERACRTAYRDRTAATGNPVVPLAEFWLDINNFLFDEASPVMAPMRKAIRDRWAQVLTIPDGARRVDLTSVELRESVERVFAISKPGWPTGVQHSPDVMIAAASAEAIRAGDFQWVLGEIHPGLNTVRYATWIAVHPEPAAVRQAMHADLGGPVIWHVATSSYGATPARLSNVLVDPADRHLVFASDSCAYDPERTMFLADFDIEEVDGRLRITSRITGEQLTPMEIFGDTISGDLTQLFGIVAATPHTPRITIDKLVVQRETWRFHAVDMPFVHIIDEKRRFLAARAWISGHDLPRYVFLRTEGESKPVFIDLASLSSIELLSRSVRRARSNAGDNASVNISEMMPSPDQLWLTDAEGHRYTSELRICAADQRGRH